MVETKEEADSSDPHGGGDKKASHGGKNFKKKNNQKSNYAVDRKTEGVPELLKGYASVSLEMGRMCTSRVLRD